MKPIRVGMIGCGGNARWHMSQILKTPDLKIVALTDPSDAMIQHTRQMSPDLHDLPVFTHHSEMLANVELDAVEISTPHTQHREQVLDSFAAGLHVLCEKPLVTSVEHAHEVIAARDKAGKVGLLSYQRHFQPEFRYIRERLQSGEMGAVTFINALQSQDWKRATAGSWRQDPALSGGGQLNDSGSHLIDIILWVTGLKASAVSCFSDPRQTPVDIDSSVSVKFEGGAMASLSVVGDARLWYEDLTIWCEKGAFFMRNGKLSVADEKGNRFAVESLGGGGNYPDRNFADAILGRAEVDSPFECGLRVIELTEAAWRSAANGGAVVQA